MGKYKQDNVVFKTWKHTINMVYHDDLEKAVRKCANRNKDKPDIVWSCDSILDKGSEWMASIDALTCLGETHIMFFCVKSEPDVIVHECMHATYHAMKDKGMVLSDESEEAYCYFIGRLSKKANKFVKDARK